MEKPKRKYTLTEKALAANRRNLIRAREVDPKIRYRPTPKRLAACHANLTRALATLRAASLTPDGYPRKSEITNQKSEAGEKKLEDGNSGIDNRQSKIVNRKWPDSPSYGTGFTRGLWAVSLRRSARLAGEAPAAFDAHVARFLLALAPRNRREQRLARGIAETVWRRLRVYRCHGRWVRANLAWLLRQAASGFVPEGWDKDGPPSPQKLAANLANRIDNLFSSGRELPDAAEKLNVRLERLSRLYVVGRGADPRFFEAWARTRRTDGRLLHRQPEAMGNPFLRPCQVEAHMAARGITPLKPFPCVQRDRSCEPCPSRGWMHLREDFARPGIMLGVAREHAQFDDLERGVRRENDLQEIPGIESLTALEAIWVKAWEGIASHGYNLQRDTVYQYAAPREVPVDIPVGQNPQPNTHQPPTLVAALWEHLQTFTGIAAHEADEINLLLETKISGHMCDALQAKLGKLPGGAEVTSNANGGTAALLMEIILAAGRSDDALFEQWPGDPLDALWQHFLSERFGPSKHFDIFKHCVEDAGLKARNLARRGELRQRVAEYEARDERPSQDLESVARQLARAQQYLRDRTELTNLIILAGDSYLEIQPLELESKTGDLISVTLHGAEWTQLFFAAVSAGMVTLPGWEFDSHARSLARVGLEKG